SRTAFALTVAGSASGATHFRGHRAFTFVTARELALLPGMRLSRGFRAFGYPPACPPSYGAANSYPGRSISCCTHQPSWTHHRTAKFPRIGLKPSRTPFAGRGGVHYQTLTVDLTMAVGMQQHEVV